MEKSILEEDSKIILAYKERRKRDDISGRLRGVS